MSVSTTTAHSISEFAAEVHAGLSRKGQKTLPSKYLYDEIGSTLFEVISLLPEYGLTAADNRILRRHAEAIVECMGFPKQVTELGSGSGKKTRGLLESLCRRAPTTYYPIEISRPALVQCERELAFLEALTIVGIEAPYLQGMAEAAALRRPEEPLTVLFLGSTLGNFERDAAACFLADVRRSLLPGDSLLLGTDLQKPVRQMIRAYNDSLGVTAAFDLNLLARMNRELGANFDLSQFRHEACYNADESRMEMHLLSQSHQTVTLPGCDLTVSFSPGETIWTESSYKFTVEEVAELGERCGFRYESRWVDEEHPFAESLFIAT